MEIDSEILNLPYNFTITLPRVGDVNKMFQASLVGFDNLGGKEVQKNLLNVANEGLS